MTIYVAAMHAQLREQLAAHCRLYAFPNEPSPPADGGFVILDSGAFGLAMKRQSIDAAHMAALAAHYQRFGAGNDRPVVGIAPDAYPFPQRTMKNWSYWHAQGYGPVAPVIQFEHGRIDLFSVMRQCAFYRQWETPFVCISNPGLRALDAQQKGMARIVATVRQQMKAQWIHILGAGWDRLDAAQWARVGVDSIDSIAYYTAAQSGEAWGQRGEHWTETAVYNLKAAQRGMIR